ncbi:conserved hypothetical protein [Paraburkholderia unamae]|uniref:hypothetical protein n=1 Tax=Paraburkholderia unamae TaxID=219649 RepID=UPI001CB5B086|nr:hypothetical protein [Paraburkholderia unamae]CAG9271009.1 conserved hypothetical protein [Paraburkholderia unamae]
MAAAQYYDQVQKAYIAYYGRPADPAGLVYWANQLDQAGGDLNSIINAFGNSQESIALYGGGNLYAEVNQIYQTLFGRAADTVGANWYVEQIATGKMTLASIALDIYNGAQGADATALQAKLDYANAFTGALLQDANSAAAYAGNAAAAGARLALAGVTDPASEQSALNNLATTIANIGSGAVTYLTSGADVVTGSNIVGSLTQYSTDGRGPTLNYNDVITGSTGGANNTLTLNDDYASANDVIPLGASISNIQTVALQTAGNAGGSAAFDTSNISGVTNLTVRSAATGEDNVKAAATTNINVSHLNTAGAVQTAGGNNVTVNTSSGDVQVGNTSIAGANPAGAVNVSAANTGTVAVFGGTTVNINDAGQNSTVQVGTNGSAVSASQPSGAVSVNATGTGIDVAVYGGTDVTVNSAGGNATHSALVQIGGIEGNTVYAPTGDVTVNVNQAAAVQFSYATDSHSGNDAGVEILGGANVSVMTNGGNVLIGSTATDSSGALLAGENPTGTITVIDSAAAEYVGIVGGTDVSVTAAGDQVVIGALVSGAAPSGTVTVNNTAAVAYNGIRGINDVNEGVSIVGGTTVNVATNAGYVSVGSSTGAAGSEATGTISVTDSSNGDVNVYGGTDVTVGAAGGTVTIGSAKGAPSGDVTVTQSAVATGGVANSASTVTVLGGNNVTVSTTGGSVTVGADGTAATGAVSVTDTYGGNNVDDITVVGGTTVSVNTTATSGDINIGSVPASVDTSGKLTNAADYATGNVTVVSATTNGSSTVYGTGDINVTTNGATAVSVSGGDGGSITDIQATLAQPGTSTLSSVTLNHVEGPTTITSDALTSLTVLNGDSGENYRVINNTAGHDLAITLGGDATAYAGAVDVIRDDNAGAVSVTDNGVASGEVALIVASATSVTVNTTAAVDLAIEAGDALTALTLNNTAAIEIFGTQNAVNLAKVDASGSTGAIVIGIDQSTTGFTGGAGDDTVVLDNYDLTAASKIVGGSGVNTLVLETALGAQGTLAAPVNLGTIAANFANLTLVGESGFYDASAFTGNLTAVDSAVTFEKVAAGTTLTVLDGASVDYQLRNSSGANDKVTITIGADGTAGTGTYSQSASVSATGVEHVTINSEGYVATGNVNAITINDSAAATLTVTGDENVSLQLQSDAGTLLSSSSVTQVDASAATGTVDVSHIAVSTGGVTITGGAGELIASGVSTSMESLTLNGAYQLDDVVTETINGVTYAYTVTDSTTQASVAQGLLDAIVNGIGLNGAAVAPFVNASVGTGANANVITLAANGADIAASDVSVAAVVTTPVNDVAAANAIQAQATLHVSSLPDTDWTVYLSINGVVINIPTGDTVQADWVLVTVQGQISRNPTLSQLGLSSDFDVNGDLVIKGPSDGSALVIVPNTDSDGNVSGSVFTIAGSAPGAAAVVQQDHLDLSAGTYVAGETLSITIAGQTITTAALTTTAAADAATALVNAINANSVLAGEHIVATVQSGTSVVITGDAAGDAFEDSDSLVGNSPAGTAAALRAGTAAVDVITTGAGGGDITIGEGGSYGGAGSETVNLAASGAVSDTIVANQGTVAVYNGVAGGVTGFVVSANATTADHLSFDGAAVSALANQSAAQNVASFVGATLTGQAAAEGATLANLTFTSVNGVLTFGATGTHKVSEFSVAQLIAAAQAIVESQPVATVLAFVAGGNTYVVASAHAGGALADASVTELIGVTGVTGLGSSAAANTIVVDNFVTTAATSANAGDAKVAVYDETGYSLALLGSGVQSAGTTSTTFANLSASAELDVAAGATYAPVITTQAGASGSNTLAIDFAAGATELKSLTVNGDHSLAIHNAAAATIDALVDATNTVSSITVDGSGSLTVTSLSGTALKAFDASAATGSLTLTAAQDGLTIKGSLAGDTIVANGAADTISVGDASHAASVGVTLSANGAGDTITLGAGDGVVSTIAAAGAGDTISLYGGSNTVAGAFNGSTPLTALGHGDTINVYGDASTVDHVWLGSAATVNIGATGHTFNGELDLNIQGDVTGATSSGGYAQTTVNAVLANNATLNITFGNATTEALAGGTGSGLSGSMVNVASATSLSQALDLAIQQALVLDQTRDAGAHTSVVNGVIELNADTGLISAFEYAGNTYVVEAVNTSKSAGAAHAALGVNDVVVEFTGTSTVSLAGMSGHTLSATVGGGFIAPPPP